MAPTGPSIFAFTPGELPRLGMDPLGGNLLVVLFAAFVKFSWKDHRGVGLAGVVRAVCVTSRYPTFRRSPTFVVGPYRCAESGVGAAPCLFGILCATGFITKRFILSAVLCVNLMLSTWVTYWGIRQWLSPDTFFERVARQDPHFIAGVEAYAQLLNQQSKFVLAAQVSDETLSWVFGSPKWIDQLASDHTGSAVTRSHAPPQNKPWQL